MGLKVADWIALLCFCAVGIQNSYQITAEMNEIMNNCPRDGGFCINVIPPPPPRRRQNRRRRPGTRTRKGSRVPGQGTPKPDPLALGQQHNRLPASAGGGAAKPNQPAAAQPAAPANNGPFSFFDNLFGTSPNDPFGSMLGMSMLSFRKKRQAMMDPETAAELPRIRRGENMYNFLNAHCRKSDFDFGCRRTGGMCCLPHL